MPRREGTLMQRLVIDELRFCCINSFLREIKGRSRKKVAEALGVSPQTIRYWQGKKFNGELKACPNCSLPQTQLRLKKTADGRAYFVRSYAR